MSLPSSDSRSDSQFQMWVLLCGVKCENELFALCECIEEGDMLPSVFPVGRWVVESKYWERTVIDSKL